LFHILIKLSYLICNCVYINTFISIHCLHMAMNVDGRNFFCSQEVSNHIYLNCTSSQPSILTDTELQLRIAVGSRYKDADKSLARPGRKQANVSVRIAWISFGVLPCRKKTWWQLVSWCCWNRAHPWLVSFLVGLMTYPHPGSYGGGEILHDCVELVYPIFVTLIKNITD